MSNFAYFPLRLINPAFDSPLTGAIMELQHLRRLLLRGDTPPDMFFQLKGLFHALESLGSARIENNRTTLSDYIESKIHASPADLNERLQEIHNIEQAMDYIDTSIEPNAPISHFQLRELHALTVSGLQREGDPNPGCYRTTQVSIANSSHHPPEPHRVQELMDELLHFINQTDDARYDLLKIALAHHRFAWIHPFRNGNGRVVRLLTYALLVKFGFNVQNNGRILNPTAVFCANRDQYYTMLSLADSGQKEALEAWAFYTLSGISHEIQKVDRLTDYDYLVRMILLPALQQMIHDRQISIEDARILKLAIQQKHLRAGDLRQILPGSTERQRSYAVQKLLKQGFLHPLPGKSREYHLHFAGNIMLRYVVAQLKIQGFTSALDD